MAIWDFITSITDKVKQNAPDLTSVKGACRSTYGYGWSAVSKIDNAVKENVVPRLNPYLPDDEGRAKIGLFATSFVKNTAVFAFHEGLNWVPGGVSLYNIVSRSLRDEKTEDYKEALKNAQARLDRLERDFNRVSKNNQSETLGPDVKVDSRIAPCLDSNANLKPEDAIRIFMMKEFGGRYMFDDLVVPGTGRGKNHK